MLSGTLQSCACTTLSCAPRRSISCVAWIDESSFAKRLSFQGSPNLRIQSLRRPFLHNSQEMLCVLIAILHLDRIPSRGGISRERYVALVVLLPLRTRVIAAPVSTTRGSSFSLAR